jgi:hypothetical protein
MKSKDNARKCDDTFQQNLPVNKMHRKVTKTTRHIHEFFRIFKGFLKDF